MKLARNGKVKAPEKVPECPVSDGSKLLWQRYMGPIAQAVELHRQVAMMTQELIAEQMAAKDGVSVEDGWRLDPERMRWVKVPVPDSMEG